MLEKILIACILHRRIENQRIHNYQRKMLLRQLRDESDPFNVSRAVFIRNYRMSQDLVMKIIDILQPHDELIYSTIPFNIKVLVALNFYATGSYQNPIACNNATNVSQPTVSRIIEQITDLIGKYMSSLISFPTTTNDLNALKNGFIEKFGVDNVIGCIDCTHVAIVAPREGNDLYPPRIFRNRKRFYSINVEAICDSKLKFLSVNARHPGSTHDSGIWTTSQIRRHVRQLEHGQNWLLGDSGYPLEPWLLTPYLVATRRHEKKFNELHKTTRNCIERAFGVLKSTFRCLLKHRTLHYAPEKAAKIINACFIIYNFLHKEDSLLEELNDDLDDDADAENESEIDSIEPIENRRPLGLYRQAAAIRDAYAQSLQ